MKASRALAAAFFILASASRTYAASYYVAPNGLDSNPGSQAQPWQTIQKAANMLSPGDTVYVRTGTYCNVHDIWNTGGNTSNSGNAFGIAVYGSSTTPATDIVIDSNNVHDLKTGSSESVVLNGNVTNFQVTNNTVHDNNNIGIDFIGFE